jgi:hypothetical protein
MNRHSRTQAKHTNTPRPDEQIHLNVAAVHDLCSNNTKFCLSNAISNSVGSSSSGNTEPPGTPSTFLCQSPLYRSSPPLAPSRAAALEEGRAIQLRSLLIITCPGLAPLGLRTLLALVYATSTLFSPRPCNAHPGSSCNLFSSTNERVYIHNVASWIDAL